MKKLIGIFMLLLVSGCGSGVYQIPKQEYQAKVQVLGVLPFLVDRTTQIDYPQKEQLFDFLTRSVAGKQDLLVEKLKDKKGYFDVRAIPLDSQLVGLSLLGGGRSYDANGLPSAYAFDSATIAEMAKRNVVDALLIVVLSGERVTETRRSRTKLESLHTQFEDIVVTAAVVDRSGSPLWQMSGSEAFRLLTLQYPDFDEAYFNKTDLVRVKDISLAGIERALAEKTDDSGKVELPKVYDSLISGIAAGISPGLLDSIK
jgi:hypothetical protein